VKINLGISFRYLLINIFYNIVHILRSKNMSHSEDDIMEEERPIDEVVIDIQSTTEQLENFMLLQMLEQARVEDVIARQNALLFPPAAPVPKPDKFITSIRTFADMLSDVQLKDRKFLLREDTRIEHDNKIVLFSALIVTMRKQFFNQKNVSTCARLEVLATFFPVAVELITMEEVCFFIFQFLFFSQNLQLFLFIG